MLQLPVKNITVIVCYDGESHTIQTYANEYRNLMMLIYDKIYTEGFGECLGMGKCGTCMVEIISKQQEPAYYERNEDTTLLRAGYTGRDVRLSCQLIIDETMDGLKVKVL